MINNINSQEQEISRAEKLNEINEAISKTRGKLFSNIGYEETEGLFFNKAYFVNGEKITKEKIDESIKEAENIQAKLNNIKTSVMNETILNDRQKKLIEDRLIKMILGLEYNKNAIYIEAEKAGYAIGNKERNIYRKNIENIETEMYGEGISELAERKEKVIDKLHQIYADHQELLSEDEKKFWEETIIHKHTKTNTIQNNKEVVEDNDIFIKEDSIFSIIENLLAIEGFDKNKLTSIEMSDAIEINETNKGILKKDVYFVGEKITKEELEEYLKDNQIQKENIKIIVQNNMKGIKKHDMPIYTVSSQLKETDIDSYFTNLGMGNNLKIVKRLKGNNLISIAKEKTLDNGEIEYKKNYIYIGASVDGKYSLKEKVLPIIFDHEVSTHIKTNMGNIKNAYIIDPERSDLEEGIAMVNQRMAKGESLDSFYEATIGDIRMFMAENFDDNDLKKLLSIYYKLEQTKSVKIDDDIRRVRNGVPIGEKGAKRSHLTYGNSKEIIKELEQLSKTEEGIKTLNKYAKVIYSTKIGYEGLEHIDEILEGIKDVNDLEPEFPIFAGKILYRKIFKGNLDKEKMLESDVRSIIETNKHITFQQKKLLINILHIIKDNSVN